MDTKEFNLVEPEKTYLLKGTFLKFTMEKLREMEKHGYATNYGTKGEPKFIITTKGQAMIKSMQSCCFN